MLSDGTAAVDILNIVGTGTVGKTRKLCAISGNHGFCVVAETYVESWDALEPEFDRMIRSFVTGPRTARSSAAPR
jgi:hypothetical protein